MTSSKDLDRAVARLVNQIGHWPPARWTATGAAPHAHALAQCLADLAAEAAAEPHRLVPRLDNDLALVDQIRVTANDLIAADPDAAALDRAVQAVQGFRATI
jgi:hypothetical protein